MIVLLFDWLFLETFNCQNDNGFFVHVIVLHKKHLSEAETVIDICICGNIRDLAFSHHLPRAHFQSLCLLLFY